MSKTADGLIVLFFNFFFFLTLSLLYLPASYFFHPAVRTEHAVPYFHFCTFLQTRQLALSLPSCGWF